MSGLDESKDEPELWELHSPGFARTHLQDILKFRGKDNGVL